MDALLCRNCGSNKLISLGNVLKCQHCETMYQAEREQRTLDKLRSVLDEVKQSEVANFRTMIYEQIRSNTPNKDTIVELCKEIRRHYVDDFMATFYQTLYEGSEADLINFINSIDVEANYPFVDKVISYVTERALTSNLILPVGNLIERASHQGVIDMRKYNELQTKFESEAEKVENDVYNPRIPRDFFVMYSSKDMDEVMKLVSYLESQDTTCFVALRNIQHGRGSREEYISILKSAMDNCNCILFVSSSNSRHTKCEAVSVEMEYIKQKEISGAPADYRNVPYHKIPYKYKKQRIEYLLDLPNGKNVGGESLVKSFFFGLEYVKCDPIDVIKRYYDHPGPIEEPQGGDEGREAFERRDFDTAFGAFEEQAMNGDPQAMCNLGYCYEVGRGIERDTEEAVRWYEKAAKGGNTRAKFNLGLCYSSGIGVDRNPDRAHELISEAARGGDILAKKWMEHN